MSDFKFMPDDESTEAPEAPPEPSIDQIASRIYQLNEQIGELCDQRNALQQLLINKRDPEGPNTQRIRGKEWEAVTAGGPVKYRNSELVDLWNDYPQFRGECLKIGEIKVSQKDADILIRTETDDEKLAEFIAILEGARLGRTGKPSVKVSLVEKGGK